MEPDRLPADRRRRRAARLHAHRDERRPPCRAREQQRDRLRGGRRPRQLRGLGGGCDRLELGGHLVRRLDRREPGHRAHRQRRGPPGIPRLGPIHGHCDGVQYRIAGLERTSLPAAGLHGRRCPGRRPAHRRRDARAPHTGADTLAGPDPPKPTPVPTPRPTPRPTPTPGSRSRCHPCLSRCRRCRSQCRSHHRASHHRHRHRRRPGSIRTPRSTPEPSRRRTGLEQDR